VTAVPLSRRHFLRRLVAPEGRIVFAGEHASLSHTWMQGALESALVAVRPMLAGQD
jgi:monoamine oxidase